MSGKEQLIVAVLSAGLAATGQTKADLRNQSRGVDFSGAASTKPMRTGAALPAICSTGEAYFQAKSMFFGGTVHRSGHGKPAAPVMRAIRAIQ
jgi:hypothetical protein